jgi:hypothetical protein
MPSSQSVLPSPCLLEAPALSLQVCVLFSPIPKWSFTTSPSLGLRAEEKACCYIFYIECTSSQLLTEVNYFSKHPGATQYCSCYNSFSVFNFLSFHPHTFPPIPYECTPQDRVLCNALHFHIYLAGLELQHYQSIQDIVDHKPPHTHHNPYNSLYPQLVPT